MIVGCANAGPGIGFHQYAVPGRHVFTNGARGEADAVFVRLDLFWNTDAHGMSSRNQSGKSYHYGIVAFLQIDGKTAGPTHEANGIHAFGANIRKVGELRPAGSNARLVSAGISDSLVISQFPRKPPPCRSIE
jgi:hypothetical protein